MVSAVVLTVVGGTAAMWKPGLVGGKLSPEGRLAMGALARVLLGEALSHNTASLSRHLDGFDALVGALQPAVRDELALLLGMTTNATGRLGLFGHRTALHELPAAELHQALQGMRLSAISLRQQAYFALRELHSGVHYAQPDAWALMGYPGPRAV